VRDPDLPAGQAASTAGNLNRLAGVRKPQSARDLDGFEAADPVTAVSPLAGCLAERNLVSGQHLEESVQPGGLSFTIAM